MVRNKFTGVFGNRGFSLLELLIAVFITGIVAASAFHFYVTMNQQVITQQEISDMQQMSRATLQEISRTVRLAGYMVPSYEPFEINGDSLTVCYSFFDTLDQPGYVTYFLQEYDAGDYAKILDRPDDMTLYKLFKQTNANTPEVFAELVTSIQYIPIGSDSSGMAITLEVQVSKGDQTFSDNDGFRTFSNTERVTMRNVGI